MGRPKQMWTSEEAASLRAGVAKHGVGKWRAILKDPQFRSTLCYRSNVDIKDKWRNMTLPASSSGSREREGLLKKTRSAPKITSDINDKIVDEKPMAMSTVTSDITDKIDDEKPIAISTVTSGKLLKVKQKYRITPISPSSDRQRRKTRLLKDVLSEPSKFGTDDIKILTRSQVDAELAHIATLTAEEAAAAADRAVAEAEAIMAEAEAAAREAEAAEAKAKAAQASAEAAFLTLKSRNATKSIAQA